MNKDFDCCGWCHYFLTTSKDTCIKYNISITFRSESCEQGKLSEWAKEKNKKPPERVEHGGVRESEFFE